MDLQLGDLAPDFNLASSSGGRLSLHSLRGNLVILYFYPKDNTPGCTQEACDFNSHLGQLAQLQAKVLGVSRDSIPSHEKFIAKYQLGFPLLSDPEGTVCASYGVLKPKAMFGKTSLGIERSTFLIDATGIIRGIWRKVKVAGHAAELAQHLQALRT